MKSTAQGEAAHDGAAAWYIDVFQCIENVLGFRSDLFETDRKSFLELLGRIRAGEASAEEMPDSMWIMADSADCNIKTLPHFTIAGDILAVSEQVADVLRGFDLGASTLHPVQLLRKDRETPFPGRWFVFQIAERKAAFEPEHSKGFLLPMFPSKKYLGSISLDMMEKPQISLNSSALSGSDIWIDPRLIKLTLLISDPLMDALRKADVLGPLRTLRCSVRAE